MQLHHEVRRMSHALASVCGFWVVLCGELHETQGPKSVFEYFYSLVWMAPDFCNNSWVCQGNSRSAMDLEARWSKNIEYREPVLLAMPPWGVTCRGGCHHFDQFRGSLPQGNIYLVEYSRRNDNCHRLYGMDCYVAGLYSPHTSESLFDWVFFIWIHYL